MWHTILFQTDILIKKLNQPYFYCPSVVVHAIRSIRNNLRQASACWRYRERSWYDQSRDPSDILCRCEQYHQGLDRHCWWKGRRMFDTDGQRSRCTATPYSKRCTWWQQVWRHLEVEVIVVLQIDPSLHRDGTGSRSKGFCDEASQPCNEVRSHQVLPRWWWVRLIGSGRGTSLMKSWIPCRTSPSSSRRCKGV